MNQTILNNWALGLAIFSFGFLTVGSVLFGATVTTSVLRGFGGGVLFGALLWLVGLVVSKEENIVDQTEEIQGFEPSEVETESTDL